MYTFSNIPNEQKANIIWFSVVGGFVLFLVIILGVGLSRGERLESHEKALTTYSVMSEPSATCGAYHKEVISTETEYKEFVEDCMWTVSDEYNQSYFSDNVVILMFYKTTDNKRPNRFYDYLFLQDDYEVIRVLYKRDRQQELDKWYVYFIEMEKDQINSAEILLD